MNIYLVKRTDHGGYDSYDSFVCYAEDEEQARYTYPNSSYRFIDGKLYSTHEYDGLNKEVTNVYNEWPIDTDTLEIDYLGEAPHKEAGVILASFNAG